jgi:hypothetical protein
MSAREGVSSERCVPCCGCGAAGQLKSVGLHGIEAWR